MRKRDITLERQWALEYEEEFNEKPTKREINIGVYGEPTPAFYASKAEKIKMVFLGFVAMWYLRIKPFALDVVKYALAFALANGIVYVFTKLF